jgi:hypothetical protein
VAAYDVIPELEEDGLLDPRFLERLRLEAEEEEDDPTETSKEEREVPPHLDVLRLCQVGALKGGLSVALDVRADELFGSLCAAIGGIARQAKLLDVRERADDVLELEVMLGDLVERWELEDLYVLVHNLNDLVRDDPRARAVAVLGEWQDMLQLWCIEKRSLAKMWNRPYFAPRNHHQLRALGHS